MKHKTPSVSPDAKRETQRKGDCSSTACSRSSDTPETEELFAPLWAKDDPPTDEELHEVTKRFRKLERERDEARRWNEEGKINERRCATERDKLQDAVSGLIEQWERRTVAADKLAHDAGETGEQRRMQRCTTKAGTIRSMTIELKRAIRVANDQCPST